jgi:tetratricopeptide (TPR) repeat protein
MPWRQSSPPRQLALVVAVALTLLSGCVSHERRGDDAAALNDWRGAYHNYRQALQDAPQDPRIAQKHERAKKLAVEEAASRAESCQASESWDCVVQQLEFVTELEPGRPGAAERLKRGRVRLGLGKNAQAGRLLEEGRFADACALLKQARGLSRDPELQSAVATTAANLRAQVQQALTALRTEGSLDQALALAESVAPQRRQVRRGREQASRRARARARCRV